MDLATSLSLPYGWAATTLGEAFRWGSGGTPTSTNNSYYGGDIPWLIIGDLDDKVVSASTNTITQAGLQSSSAKWVEVGSVLLAMYGSIGKLGIAGTRLTTNQAIAFTNPDPIEAKYLFYYLLWQRRRLNELGSGATQSNISQTVIKAFPFVLAPLPEQHRIVAEIERQFSLLDAGIANLKRVQANLKRYRAAVLQAACTGQLVPTEAELAEADGRPYEPADVLLTRILAERRARWEAEQLAKMEAQGKLPLSGAWKAKYQEPTAPDTCGLPELPEGWGWASPEQLASPDDYSLVIGPFGSDLKVSDYREHGVPLVFVRDIRSGVFGGTNTRYVSAEKAARLKAHKVVPGDILITKMGDPPGDACLYPKSSPAAIATADCIKWTLSPILPDARFFVNLVNSNPVKSQILQITKGVAQLKVSLGRFRQISLPLPPLAEQERIVAEVERRLSVVDSLEQVVKANLKRAERLRQAVLKEAFAGRLVPQDPANEPASVLLERIKTEREAQARAPAKAKVPAKAAREAGRKQGGGTL